MDESKPTPPAKPIHGSPIVPKAPALARGSGDIGESSERTEHSVMEGLPPAKAERIAAMRRELADLQRQLIDAQQRIATELQGRADDAERFETLEARLQAQEQKAQEDAKRIEAQIVSLRETKALLETRDTELATRTKERDSEQATNARLARELEDLRKQHSEVTEQLDAQSASLRDAKALLAARDGELATITSERDARNGELEQARRDLDARKTELEQARRDLDARAGELEQVRRDRDAASAKVRDIGTQLVRLGQDLVDGAGVVPPGPPTPAPPPPRPKAPSQPQLLDVRRGGTSVEMSEEKPTSSRTGLKVLIGVLVAGAATIAIVKVSRSGANVDERAAVTPPSAEVAPPATQPAPRVEVATDPSAASAQPTPEVNAPAKDESAPPAKDGVVLLPPAAADHRVFVDGRQVEVKGLRAVVACGTREIRIGSRGPAQQLDVACGGETTLPPDR